MAPQHFLAGLSAPYHLFTHTAPVPFQKRACAVLRGVAGRRGTCQAHVAGWSPLLNSFLPLFPPNTNIPRRSGSKINPYQMKPVFLGPEIFQQAPFPLLHLLGHTMALVLSSASRFATPSPCLGGLSLPMFHILTPDRKSVV